MPAKDSVRGQLSCFVVMPFGEIWKIYYQQIYEPAIVEAGLMPVRADDVFRAGSILQDIVDMLTRSSIVLADISENNRNVHYELGLAHALGKPTILIAPKDLQLFFDVGQERMLTYDKDSPSWGADLQYRIVQAVQETIKDPQTAIPTAFMHIKPTRMASDELIVRLRRIEEKLAEIAVGAPAGRQMFASSLQHKMHSLPDAEQQAEELLRRMSQQEAVERLTNAGFGRAMAESAVAVAARRLGSTK